MMETQTSNKRLQAEVRQELARESSINSDAVGITADRGLIYLSGHALGVTRRQTAEEAALRVDGVRAVIDELKVRPGCWEAHADLACVAMDSLKQLIDLPDGRVKVIVRDGKVTLKGVVSSTHEKTLVGSTVERAIGRKVTLDNAIDVKPGAFPSLGPDDVLTMSPAPRGDHQFEDATPEATGSTSRPFNQ
jgi:BON domain